MYIQYTMEELIMLDFNNIDKAENKCANFLRIISNLQHKENIL